MMANLTLYASIEDTSTIESNLFESMADYVIQQDDESIIILKKGLFKKKHICSIHIKERTENEDPNQFTGGFVGYLAAELMGDTELKEKILFQAVHVNTMISFQVEDSDVEDFWPNLIAATEKIGGLLFLPSGYILDSTGAELVDPDGKIIADDVQVIVAEKETEVAAFSEVTEESIKRRRSTQAVLSANKIPYIDHLPLLPDSKSVQLKSAEEIARRVSAMLIITQFVREIIVDEKPENIKASRRIAEVFLNRYGVKMNLTPAEEAFLQQEEFTKQQLVDKMWLFEAAWAMLWSVNLVDLLPEPTNICDVDAVLNLLTSYTNIGEMLVDVELRSADEILDRMDENYSYHWACVEARVNGETAPALLDEGVVLERQRAFNWLTQLQNEAWDDVTISS